MKKRLASTIILIAACGFSSLGWADDALPANAAPAQVVDTNYPDAWHFSLGAYYWYSAANGFFRIQDQAADVNLPLIQMRQHLDFGGFGSFEMQRYNWAFILNPSYIHYTENAYVHRRRAKISQGTVTIDAGGYYLLMSDKCPQEDFVKATLELLIAARIMTFHSTIHYYDDHESAADGSGFIVPVLGARVKYRLNPKTRFWVDADFGGFKLDYVNSTWSAMIGVGHQLSKHWDVNLAYKALGVNYSKTVVTNNMLFQGPMLGLSYSW